MDGVPRVWKQHTERNAPDTGPFASIFILVGYGAYSGSIAPGRLAIEKQRSRKLRRLTRPRQFCELTCDWKSLPPRCSGNSCTRKRALAEHETAIAIGLIRDGATSDRTCFPKPVRSLKWPEFR